MDKIENYMSEDLIVIDVGATIQDAAMAMRDNDVHSVIVKEEREYVGILTGVDITRKIVAPGLDPAQTKVSLIMESPLYTIDAGLPMDEALLAMKKYHTRHIVVTSNSNVMGILSINDFVRYHSQNINDPVAEFWSNSDCLLAESTFNHAFEKLLEGMSKKLGDSSKLGRAIINKDPLHEIAQYAEEEGLQEFASILRLARED